jgi:hypothetical protein
MTYDQLLRKLVDTQQELLTAYKTMVDLNKRILDLEAEIKVRPSSSHGLEKYMSPDANNGVRGNRPGSDTGAHSIMRGDFVTDTEENPVQVNFEVPHR